MFIFFEHCFANGMDLKYIDVTHFQLTKWCSGIINQQSWTILMFRWYSYVLRISEPDIIWLEELGTMSLNYSVNAIASSCQVESLQFSLWCRCNDVIISLKWLITTTCKVAPITVLNYLLGKPHTCIIHENSMFHLNSRNRDWNPDLPRTESGYANH